MRSRFSTATIVDSKYLAPRLAAEGPWHTARRGASTRPLLPVHLDHPWNLQAEDQSARASLLRQSPKGERAPALRVVGERP